MPDNQDTIIIRRNSISTRGLTLEQVSRLRQIEAQGDVPLSVSDRLYVARIQFRQGGLPSE